MNDSRDMVNSGRYKREQLKGSFYEYMKRREYRFLKKIVREFFPQQIPRYLDFACGTGRVLSFMENRAQASFGIDAWEPKVEVAKRKCPKSQLIVADVLRDELRELEPFNLITSFRFFGTLNDQLRRLVFSKLNQCLIDGGYLIFNNHRNPWSAIGIYKKLGNFLDDFSDLNYLMIRKHLRKTNFKIVRTYGIGSWLLSPGMNNHEICSSRVIQRIERISMLPFVKPFCPDIIVVAQKIKSI